MVNNDGESREDLLQKRIEELERRCKKLEEQIMQLSRSERSEETDKSKIDPVEENRNGAIINEIKKIRSNYENLTLNMSDFEKIKDNCVARAKLIGMLEAYRISLQSDTQIGWNEKDGPEWLTNMQKYLALSVNRINSNWPGTYYRFARDIGESFTNTIKVLGGRIDNYPDFCFPSARTGYYDWPGNKILNRVLGIENGQYAKEPYPQVESLIMRGTHDSESVKNKADQLKSDLDDIDLEY